jgi:hypothetical protein
MATKPPTPANIRTGVKPFREAPVTIGVPSEAGHPSQGSTLRRFSLNLRVWVGKVFGMDLTLNVGKEGEHSLPLS